MRIPRSWLWLAALLALGAETACVPQERVTGRVDVIDGDSFKIGSAEIRLFGADAPEGRQSCTRSGDDWRTIRANLRMQPAFRYRDIRELLAWLVGEIDQRLAMRRSGQVWDTSLFLAFDEYPLIAQNVPEAADLVGRTLREGRKVDVFVLGAFQDALVRSLGGDGAVRENYRTAYYLGGDQHTARVLLDVRGRVDETHLGHGVALLRSPATTPAREVRVPRLSNEQIRALLPASTGVEALPGSGPEVAAGSGPEAAVRERRVLQLLAAGMSQNEIIRQLWNATGGRAYQEAAAVIREIRQRMEGENGQ